MTAYEICKKGTLVALFDPGGFNSKTTIFFNDLCVISGDLGIYLGLEEGDIKALNDGFISRAGVCHKIYHQKNKETIYLYNWEFEIID